jgi:predicted dehydrogenase
MKPVKLGIIGCGPISQYAHLPAARKSELVDLLAICDQADDLLRAMSAQYQIPQTFTDHVEFLKSADVEAVVLAVPDAFHIPLALECLHFGKHVLVEKPLAPCSAEAEVLEDIIQETGLKVLVGNMKRHDPGIEFAREFITERISPLFSIDGWYCDTALRPQLQDTLLQPPLRSERSIKPETDPRADREKYSLYTHGIHLVNTLHYLGGPIAGIVGIKTESQGSYSWHAVTEYQSGAIGHFELTVKINANWSEGFRVHGKFGSVTGKTYLPFFRLPSEVKAFDIRTGVTETPVGADSDPYKRQLDSFARSIRENTPLACTVADAIRDLKVLEALERSLQEATWQKV